ncbi:MAG TPA: PEP-CTERM sorting domain-containing protein [Gemmataceae bacterium]|nr:PEP-CTERM sorting domain-containing protein [Gemmataceae bacterium]
MHRFAVLAAVPVLLTLGTQARAEPITWSYSWSSDPSVVTSDDGSLGKITMLPSVGGPINGSKDSGDGIMAVGLDASGTGTFTNRGYNLTLHLTDEASHTSGDLTFAGALSGTLASGFTNNFLGDVVKPLPLGGNLYTVAIGLFVPPAPGVPGRIGANVTVNGPGDVLLANDVPEPASLLLAGLALSALAARFRRPLRARPLPG